MDQKAKGDDSRALFMPLRKFLSAKKSLHYSAIHDYRIIENQMKHANLYTP